MWRLAGPETSNSPTQEESPKQQAPNMSCFPNIELRPFAVKNALLVDADPQIAIANPADDPTRHMALRETKGMRPGGFGVLLAQHLVDELIYGQDGNEVLLVKYLHSAGSKSA